LENIIELQTLIDHYENFINATYESRAESEKCRDYYDSYQLTDEEIRINNKRGQPSIVNNRIKVKIDFALGLERQVRTDPKAFPRTPKHDMDANTATDTVRYIMDNNDYNQKRSRAHKNLQIEGSCGYELNVKPGRDGFEITVNDIFWDRMFWDHYSRLEDFSEAKVKGVVIWMDHADGVNKFGKDKEDVLSLGYEYSSSDTFEDKPSISWGDKTRKRVKVCYITFLHEEVWHYSYFTAGGFLVEPQVSPFLDENGEPFSNLLFQSASVDREGNRYGPVKQILGLQDEINKRRNKALHLSSTRQTYGNKRSFGEDGPAKAKRELHKADGHIEIEYGEFGKDFGILPTNDMTSYQFELLQEAKNEMDVHGVNAAMSGKESRNMSGRALIQRSQQSSTEIGAIFDGLRSLDVRVYRAVWNMARQFWKEEKWMRVTDDETSSKWVGINKKVTMKDKIIEKYGQIPPEIEGDPRLNAVVDTENQISDLDVDFVLQDMPDTANIQQEQFEIISQLAMSRPEIPLEAVIEASQIRDKYKLIESIRGTKEQQEQQAQAGQQQAQQIEKEKEAEIRYKNAQSSEKETKAALNEAEMMQMMNAPYIDGVVIQE